MEATQHQKQEQQQQQQQSLFDRKIRELNESLKEYIGEARLGAQMGNYESSQVFYEGIMREIEKLIALSKNNKEIEAQRKEALLGSLKKLELELEAVKSLASAMEPIRSSLLNGAAASAAAVGVGSHLVRPSSSSSSLSSASAFEPIELPVNFFFFFSYEFMNFFQVF